MNPILFAAALAVAPAAQSAPAPGEGLEPSAVRQWLVERGGEVAPLSNDPRPGVDDARFVVTDRGLSWVVSFPGCRAVRCGDLQIGTTVERAGLTVETANAWNRDHRFAKAHFNPATGPAAAPTVTLQMDAVIDPAKGPDQLGDAVALWIQLVRDFARATAAPTAQ